MGLITIAVRQVHVRGNDGFVIAFPGCGTMMQVHQFLLLHHNKGCLWEYLMSYLSIYCISNTLYEMERKNLAALTATTNNNDFSSIFVYLGLDELTEKSASSGAHRLQEDTGGCSATSAL